MNGNNYDYGQGYFPSPEEPEQKGKGFRFWFLTGAVAVLIAAAAVAAALLIRTQVKTQQYNSYITAGNEYYNSGDYANAIVEYEKALDTDEMKSGAYINMSLAYTAMGDYDSALQILTRGYDLIHSDDLQKRIDKMQILVDTVIVRQHTSAEMKQLSEHVTVENTTFDMVAEYTYTDYYRDFGTPSDSRKSENILELYYEAAGFYASYYDLENEIVLNSDGNSPVASAKPCGVRFAEVSSLFGSSEEDYVVSKEKLQELLGGQAEFYRDDADGNYYMKAEYKNCIVTVMTDEGGNIVSKTAWNRVEPMYRSADRTEETTGKVSGYVQDAVTGAGMQATLKVRALNSRTGTVIEQLSSAADGSYTYEGEPGKYTVEAGAPGYITEYFDIEVNAGQVKTGENVVLSPNVASGEIRIVLTWGAAPTDLDSHTEGMSSSGGSFHISYQNQTAANVGSLDVDDVNGYGPETTTLTDAGASFTFRVEDFTGSGTMGSSGATVKVYLGGNAQPVTYTVPGGSGNNWTVFRYENGTITPINTIN